MSLIASLGTLAAKAVKAYKDSTKKTSSTSNSTKSSSTSSKKSSSGSTSSSYTPKGSNTDSYIQSTNADDYNAIQAAKQAYADAQKAGDTAGMQNANAAANAIRKKYGYSGGSDGSEYIALQQEVQEEKNPYEEAMADLQNRYDALSKQQQEANRLAVKQGTQRLENQKTNINQSYDDSARQAYIANMQSKKNLPQQLAASGLTGGATETANLGLQTSYENNLNNININRNNAINDIDNAIIDLKNNGDLTATEQALANSQAALSAYQNLLGNKINYDITKKQNDLSAQLSTIGQYSNDYQAEIDRRTAINPNDPLIPYLIAARQEKINAQNQANQEAVKSTVEQQRELAWKLFQETGIADEYISSILGIPQGTTTLDYTKNQYDISKPYYKPSSGNISDAQSNAWKLFQETGIADEYIASTLGIPVGTTTLDYQKVYGTNNTVDYNTHKSIIEQNYALRDVGKNVIGYDIQSIKDYLEKENLNGRLSDSDAKSLLAYYGISY